ncbi:MAG: hypothetical protein KIT47_00470 [Rhodoferax sp.]|nr:hypothetical protein [Rhodoferax sp.]
MGKNTLITLGLLATALITTVLKFLVWEDRLGRDLKAWNARMDALCAAHGGTDVANCIDESAVAPLIKESFASPNPPGHHLSWSDWQASLKCAGCEPRRFW